MRALILLALVPGVIMASGPDIKQDTNVAVVTANSAGVGDVNGGQFKTDNFALSYGPDNDINDCMAHWSVLIVTFPKRNKFCERQEFVSWAQAPLFHTPQSIKIMCSDPLAGEVFGSTQECVTIFTPEDIPTPIPTPRPDEDGYRPDEAGEVSKCHMCRPPNDAAVQTQMAQQEEEYENLAGRLARVESGQRVSARKAQERRDYAQQTIEKLDESER